MHHIANGHVLVVATPLSHAVRSVEIRTPMAAVIVIATVRLLAPLELARVLVMDTFVASIADTNVDT